jgi:hypothetical protein
MTPVDDRVCTHTAGAYEYYHAGSTSSRTHYVHPPALNYDYDTPNTRSHMHPHMGAYMFWMPAADTAAHTTYVHPAAHNYELFRYGRSRTQSHSCILERSRRYRKREEPERGTRGGQGSTRDP